MYFSLPTFFFCLLDFNIIEWEILINSSSFWDLEVIVDILSIKRILKVPTANGKNAA